MSNLVLLIVIYIYSSTISNSTTSSLYDLLYHVSVTVTLTGLCIIVKIKSDATSP